ncbi:pinin/SDK/memA/ protein conserved region-domain-containing protein [Lophiotrema nucula]|uniref:Pinin/SDK/memA/ protein conserved region-domain-containing protein n=1 Tax=Lophiotrema nucula TaxID=690887 RepID=A0A6A5YZL5_9PLEO|nr:pinin/SDK/memA/ protein conserved region-domain-containing protein [Lophiotrema nucula]
MDGSIASAVVLPEPDPQDEPVQPPSPISLKRRQSSISEADSKRQRLNSIDANANATRRGSTADDASMPAPATGRRERGRERRLFGAALGALSQNSTTAAQRRRSEIEKRQQAQRRLEEQESDQRKLERDVKRRAQREKQQKVFDKQAIRFRHDNLLNMAHFLKTETEPHLYYKPWETTPDEEDRIEDQITEAKEIIRQELDEHEARQQRDEPERDASRLRSTERDAGAFSSGKEHDADAHQQHFTANGATNDSEPIPKDLERIEDHTESNANEAVSGELAVSREQSDTVASHDPPAEDSNKDMMDVDNGEEVVEAAEDTVIY